MKIDDLLGECIKVFLFAVGRNRGERKKYKGELCCSGEELDQRHPWKRRKEESREGEEGAKSGSLPPRGGGIGRGGHEEDDENLNPLPVSGRGQGEGHGKVGDR